MSNEKRQEQIYKKAEGDCIAMLESIERGDIVKGSICPQSYRAGFMDGAEWADSHPAWVSVEDELPKEKGRLFLVCDKYGRVGESAYDVEDDIWYRQSGMVLNPTHWMQLPKPPVKKGGQDESNS